MIPSLILLVITIYLNYWLIQFLIKYNQCIPLFMIGWSLVYSFHTIYPLKNISHIDSAYLVYLEDDDLLCCMISAGFHILCLVQLYTFYFTSKKPNHSENLSGFDFRSLTCCFCPQVIFLWVLAPLPSTYWLGYSNDFYSLFCAWCREGWLSLTQGCMGKLIGDSIFSL